jgi:hypothetical protein
MNSETSTDTPAPFEPGPLREFANELSRWTSQMEAHAGLAERKCRARRQKSRDLIQQLEESVANAGLLCRATEIEAPREDSA